MSSLFRRFLQCIFLIYNASFLTVFHDACLYAARHSTHSIDTFFHYRRDDEKMEAIMNSTPEKNWTFLFSFFVFFLFPFCRYNRLSFQASVPTTHFGFLSFLFFCLPPYLPSTRRFSFLLSYCQAENKGRETHRLLEIWISPWGFAIRYRRGRREWARMSENERE